MHSLRSHRRPTCGRVGSGGYATDWIGYQICVGGTNSCLHRHMVDQGLSPSYIVAKSLERVFRRRPVLAGCLHEHIAKRLLLPEEH